MEWARVFVVLLGGVIVKSLVVLVLALLSAPAAFAQEVDAPAFACAGISPVENTRATRGDAHSARWSHFASRRLSEQGTPDGDPTTMDPRGIGMGEAAELRAYSEEDLRCWGENGDQLAAYAVAMRIAAESSESHEWLDRAAEGKDVLTERNATGRPLMDVCAPRVQDGYMDCEYGLPEAQALIGVLTCSGKRPGTREEGMMWIERAVLGGLWSARQFEGYCKDE
jgi:hypothetical protein